MRAGYFEHHPECLGRVEALWAFRSSERAHHKVLPDGRIDLLTRFKLGRNGAISNIRLIIAGPAKRFSTVFADIHTGLLGVRFHPGWGGACLGIDAAALRENVLLGDEAIRSMKGRAEALLRARTIEALRTALLDTARELAAGVRLDGRFARTIAAIELLQHYEGRCSVEFLARSAEVSVRTLSRNVSDAAGLSVKSLAAVFRFQKSMRALRLDPFISLANLAADAGYSDQSHMTREFRELGGFTPGSRPNLPVINIPRS